ncbi:phosphodiester glycosidase family protein [Merismopedia glauca]|nr:phosphodiester glycosidase family protein [Merismopedia glauca]
MNRQQVKTNLVGDRQDRSFPRPCIVIGSVSGAIARGAIALTITLATGNFLPAIADGLPNPSPSPIAPPPKPTIKGVKVSLNGKIISLPWHRWQSGKKWHIGIADVPLMQNFGVELLDTSDSNSQPWRWFGKTSSQAVTKFINPYRYLDLTEFARIADWKLQIGADTLYIITPTAEIQEIQLPPAPQTSELVPSLPQPQRFTILLDIPTPWKISQEKGASILTIWGHAIPEVAAKFTPTVPFIDSNTPKPVEDTAPTIAPSTVPTPALPQLTKIEDRTQIRFNVPPGWQTQVTSATNPDRLVIDIAPDVFKSRNILWSRGVSWRQQYLGLKTDKFAVTWLEINPKQVQIRPIWSNPNTLVATAPLGKTADLWQAVAAINAGFFNRNLLVPLGVLRRDRQWLSSPILNRGAIAWNDKGEFKIAKAIWKESLNLTTGENLPIVQLNSGFIQPGISRYTPAWGTTYTPMSNNETILVVENNQVANQIPGGLARQTSIPIPIKGYLLVARGESSIIPSIGSQLRLDTQIVPTELNRYPQIIGAGPVLLQNRQIVLDGLSEQFKEKFTQETAIRSAIATNSSGQVLIVAVHNRAGGAGATLIELAQLLQQMGAVDALNLDGGSSTSLYLGGQLINRSPATAARVHNAIGIFALPNR